MKIFPLSFALFFALGLPLATEAQFTYTTNFDNTLTLTGYTGPGGAVIIPDTANGMPITIIGYEAFYNNSSCTSVILGTNVLSIEQAAFFSCLYLTNVNIPSGVNTIGESAFADCGLTGAAIPDSVTSIGMFGFVECSKMVNVTIGSGVTNIGSDAFTVCTSLQGINVDANNKAYSSVKGVLFDKAQSTLLAYPEGLHGNYTIPNSVTSIGEDAFDASFFLTGITFPNSVTGIEVQAFYACRGLTNVYFTGNAPEADPSAFSDTSAKIYYLPGTAGWSNTFAGLPTAPWYLSNPLILNSSPGPRIQNKQFGFTVSWATNASVVVEARTNLASGAWQPLQTNALVNGSFYFSDSQSSNYPSRFYRVRNY